MHPSNSGIRIPQKINVRGTTAFGISYVVTVPTKLTGSAVRRKQFMSKEQAEAFAEDEWSGFRKQGEVYLFCDFDRRFNKLLRHVGFVKTERLRKFSALERRALSNTSISSH